VVNDFTPDGWTFPTKPYCDGRNKYGRFDMPERIDRIFASYHLKQEFAFIYRYAPAVEASDHFPVVVKLSMDKHQNKYKQ